MVGIEDTLNSCIAFGIHQQFIRGSYRFYAIFFTQGKAGGLQIRRCRGFAVTDYGFALGALALKPSDFCNMRAIPAGGGGRSPPLSAGFGPADSGILHAARLIPLGAGLFHLRLVMAQALAALHLHIGYIPVPLPDLLGRQM